MAVVVAVGWQCGWFARYVVMRIRVSAPHLPRNAPSNSCGKPGLVDNFVHPQGWCGHTKGPGSEPNPGLSCGCRGRRCRRQLAVLVLAAGAGEAAGADEADDEDEADDDEELTELLEEDRLSVR